MKTEIGLLIEAAVSLTSREIIQAAEVMNAVGAAEQAAALRRFPSEPWRAFLLPEVGRMLVVLEMLGVGVDTAAVPHLRPAPIRTQPMHGAGCGGDPWDIGR